MVHFSYKTKENIQAVQHAYKSTEGISVVVAKGQSSISDDPSLKIPALSLLMFKFESCQQKGFSYFHLSPYFMRRTIAKEIRTQTIG